MTSDAGIYEVLNVMDGRSYIGSSVRLDVRLTQHRCSLESGNHRNRFLQRAWNKDGTGAFLFRPLLYCSPKDLLLYEQICIDGLRPEYNLCRVAGSRLGTKYTPEARARLAALRKAAPRSPKQLEHLARMAEMNRGKPGRSPSAEERARISASLKGRKQSPELIAKRIKRGRVWSEESRAKLSATKAGKKRPTFSAEWRENMSAALKGRKHSPEAIEKMAAARRAYWAARR
jgi:group I intron endonuclease